jgi:antitoxin component YwqK of YwqJK toxin-antitoxin module
MKTVRIAGLFVCNFIFLIFIADAQSDTLNRTDKFGKKYGTWIKQENGKLLWKATFYNGEPVGYFIHFHPNKRVKDSLYYHPNSPKVDAVTFHTNGKKASEGVFINKIKDGKWLYYNNDGKLIAEDNYKNGKKNGISKLYSSQDGTLLKEEPWENNVLHGEYKEYYTTGQLRLKWNYKKGKIDGPYESYYVNGSVWNKGQYVAGLRHGTWICYDREGNELKVEEFDKQKVKRTVLGFKAPGRWQKLDAKVIAYFYNNPGENIFIQLRTGNKIMLSEDNSLLDIANLAGVELFIFLNENFLSSYEAIKKVTPINENEAEILVKPTPPFPVYTYDDYYKDIKSLLDTSAPQEEGYE